MSNKRILIVVGTRPNFIKVTQFKKVAKQFPNIEIKIVHTGQHQTDNMSKIFFEQLKIEVDYYLNVSSTNAVQILSNTMIELEKLIFHTYKPDLILVVGDVTATLAGALTANKMNIQLGHVESGLRSNDREMPEEINRILTDEMADFLFVTEQSGIDNLKKEGKNDNRIHFVGNTMIDTLFAFQNEINSSVILGKLKILPHKYVLMTMHRPATVDKKEGLTKLIELINFLTEKYKVVFPIHPRTVDRMKFFQMEKLIFSNKNLLLLEPLDYFAFQKLIAKSKVVITDSGGIQEETSFCKIPCLTLRPNTERPSTIELGTNEMLPFEIDFLKEKMTLIEKGKYKKGNPIPFWDGKATDRIMNVLASKF